MEVEGGPVLPQGAAIGPVQAPSVRRSDVPNDHEGDFLETSETRKMRKLMLGVLTPGKDWRSEAMDRVSKRRQKRETLALGQEIVDPEEEFLEGFAKLLVEILKECP